MQANRIVLILLGIILVNCQTLPEVQAYEPRKFCDVETMGHAETMPGAGKIDAYKARLVVDALRDCGKYTHDIAAHNTAAAQELREKTSRIQPTKDWALIFETAILIAVVIVAAL